jgi:glycosyltransferase involved in cell wall biosynthesis
MTKARNKKLPISAAVITRNSGATLERCLASLSFLADVVVVDAGSGDDTLAIAGRAGARIFNRAWTGYTDQRNFALDQCLYAWVLVVDADEAVSLGLARELGQVMADTERLDAYQIPFQNLFLGRWLRHGGLYPDHHLRFFNRRKFRFQQGPYGDVHEGVQADGPVGTLAQPMVHHAYPGFGKNLSKLGFYSGLEAEGRFRKGLRAGWYGFTWRPLERFLKNYFLKAGFLDGMEGFLYCSLTALYAFSINARLWELSRTPRQGEPARNS